MWFGTIRFSVKLFPPAPRAYLCHKVFKTPFKGLLQKNTSALLTFIPVIIGIAPKMPILRLKKPKQMILVSLYQLILFKRLALNLKCTLNLKCLSRFHHFLLAGILNTRDKTSDSVSQKPSWLMVHYQAFSRAFSTMPHSSVGGVYFSQQNSTGCRL